MESHGIPVHIDNPEVGADFSEHPMVPLYFRVNSTETADSVFRDPAVFGAKLEQWITSKTGLFSNSPGNIQAYYRLDENDPLLRENPEVASEPNSPHFEAIFVVSFFVDFAFCRADDESRVVSRLLVLYLHQVTATGLRSLSDSWPPHPVRPFHHHRIVPLKLTNTP